MKYYIVVEVTVSEDKSKLIESLNKNMHDFGFEEKLSAVYTCRLASIEKDPMSQNEKTELIEKLNAQFKEHSPGVRCIDLEEA